MQRFPGKNRVLIEMSPAPGLHAVYLVEKGGIEPGQELFDAAVEALGADAVRWKSKKLGAGGGKPRRRAHATG